MKTGRRKYGFNGSAAPIGAPVSGAHRRRAGRFCSRVARRRVHFQLRCFQNNRVVSRHGRPLPVDACHASVLSGRRERARCVLFLLLLQQGKTPGGRTASDRCENPYIPVHILLRTPRGRIEIENVLELASFATISFCRGFLSITQRGAKAKCFGALTVTFPSDGTFKKPIARIDARQNGIQTRKKYIGSIERRLGLVKLVASTQHVFSRQ